MSLSEIHQGKFGMFQESRLDTSESLLTDVLKKTNGGDLRLTITGSKGEQP